MNEQTKIFIVDDDAGVRDALSMMLDAAGYSVETFHSAADFLGKCTHDIQGCIILDVDMPDIDGPTLQEELTRRCFHLPVIFLSGHGTIPITVRTIKAGAMDFLTKPVEGPVLLAHVHKALEQGEQVKRRIASFQSTALRLEALTEREREVLMLTISGYISKEIAQRLGISYRTVEIHRAHILQKTGASNMLELAHIAGMLEMFQAPE